VSSLDELRRIADEMPPPRPELETYLAKVHGRAFTVTDADVEGLKAAGIGEDEIFEQTVRAAIAEGLRRIDRAEEVID
jgi:hypothetical protein